MRDKDQKDFQFPTAEKPVVEGYLPAEPEPLEPSEAAIDSGVEESFPASDPVSVSVTRIDRKGGN